MSAMASQITSVSIVCLTVCTGGDQRKRQSPASHNGKWNMKKYFDNRCWDAMLLVIGEITRRNDISRNYITMQEGFCVSNLNENFASKRQQTFQDIFVYSSIQIVWS